MFGNNLANSEEQMMNLLFPKLISMNSLNFDYVECCFNERLMNAKDMDGMSREGCGRVCMHQELGLTHSYTLECNY